MIEDLKPYPQYKESGLPWLGEVPSHWETARSKRLFRQRKEFAQSDDQQLSATQAFGVIPQALYEQRTGYRVVKISMHLDKRKHVQADDFVISMRSFQGGLERAWAAGAIRSSYVVLEPSAEVSAGYFQHLFKSHQYINALRATSDFIRDGQDLNFGNFCGVDLPLIPLQEQASIARFLAWAMNRLDRAIGAKRRIIALLQEQKQAIIHRAVTRGLDPSVPLKDSGIPWLGEIPEHWEVKKIRSLAEVYGGMTPSKSAERYWTGDTPWISPKDMKKIEVTGSIAHISDAAVRETGIALIPFPAVLFVVRGMILARRLPVAVTRIPVTINQDMKGLMPRVAISAEYLAFLLSGAQKEILGLVEEAGHGTKCLRTDSWASFEVPLPARQEQNAICNFLLSANSAIDNAALHLDSEITLLLEYRTRLIADVVTGKLDVREVAKGLPEELQVQPDMAAGYDADENVDDAESDLMDTAED